MDMVLDLLRQHFDLCGEELVFGRGGLDVIDENLGAIVFDIGFIESVIFDLAAETGVEDLFLDGRMDLELKADLMGD